MDLVKLDSIKSIPISSFDVDGGKVLHGIKNDDVGFVDFGEVYFSYVNPGAIKAWKLHQRMTLNLVVPLGSVRFVFSDALASSNYRVESIGEENFCRLTVPPKIWFGFQGMASEPSLVVNIADLKHDENEVVRKPITDFCFEW